MSYVQAFASYLTDSQTDRHDRNYIQCGWSKSQ